MFLTYRKTGFSMQIAEITNQGLRRAYSLVIPADIIAAKVNARLAEVSKTIKMPGFRPGKVPPNLVKKMHGAALRGQRPVPPSTDGGGDPAQLCGVRVQRRRPRAGRRLGEA
jgi:trigger factor